MMVNWSNPYANREGTWMRGNLHTHTSPASGCGRVPLDQTLTFYEDGGYDFLSICDHMKLTLAKSDRLIIIPGIEWNHPDGGRHVGLYSCIPSVLRPAITISDQEELLTRLSSRNSLLILNHPNWQLHPHYRREELLALTGYDGLEVFNGVIKRLEGYEISTDKWDYLLSNERRVLGFASDDFHIKNDLYAGWNVVRTESASPEAVFTALKSGNFYASSGVTLTDIYRENDYITVESADGEEIQAIGHGGRVLQIVKGCRITVDAGKWDTDYIRFTIYGIGSSMAWTQPFFLAR
ncbi:MAG: hypothetical protein PHX89_04170 [bacterium]|jgi:hypothetical protein|nr:hypothetical protein [bacterium]